MNCNMPGFPVLRHLPEFAQTHVHWVSDTIQPSHPLLLPFSFCLQSFQASGSFPMSRLFASGDQSIGVSTPVLLVNIQGWFLLGLTGLKWSESRSVMSNSLRPHGLYSPWNSPGQNTRMGSLSLLQGIFPTQGSNPGLLPCRPILYQLSHKGTPRILEWVAYPFSRGSSWPKNQTRVSYIAGRFFPNWAIREGLISLVSKGLSRVFSSTKFWRHPFLGTQQRW